MSAMVSRVLHADVDQAKPEIHCISVRNDITYFKHLFFVFPYNYYVITISLLNSTIKLLFNVICLQWVPLRAYWNQTLVVEF